MSTSTGSGHYAYMILSRDRLDDTGWHRVDATGQTPAAAGRGVVDQGGPDPRAAARALLDAYLDHLAADPDQVAYWLYEDDYDTAWQIRLWDIPATGYDTIATVPPAGDPTRLNYPIALVADRTEPASVITLPGPVVRSRPRAKQTTSHRGGEPATENRRR